MGKFHSKHGDCYINVNTHINSMLSSDSDCSHQPLIREDSDVGSKEYTEIHVPLQVVLPPVIRDAISEEVKSADMDRKDSHTDTDTTDNNVSVNRTPALQVEEFECGLSVQSTHLEKQEWSFTLYDFDGRGRVTKEDLGQLLKSLYDAVGSTISLPPEGTKSLKLRLTVSPDQTKLQQKTASAVAPDLNRKECNHDKEQKHTPKKDINSKLNNGLMASSPLKQNNNANHHEDGLVAPSRVELRNNLSKAHRGRHKQGSPSKRLSTAEHHHGADVVQHNTQHTRQKQQKVRRHHSEVTTPQTSIHHTPKRSNQATVHSGTSLENPDRRNYYLDLAGIENPASSSLLNTSLPEPVLDTAASPQRVRGAKSRSKQRADKHSRKPEAGGDHAEKKVAAGDDPVQLLSDMNQVLAGVGEVSLAQAGTSGVPRPSERQKSAKAHTGLTTQAATPSKTNRHVRHVTANGVAAALSPLLHAAQASAEAADGSPCHRRHRPRDKNHVRAMQQVADWIDKEHVRQCDGAPVIIERHEHHHIHEHHHHHHYHHYHGT